MEQGLKPGPLLAAGKTMSGRPFIDARGIAGWRAVLLLALLAGLAFRLVGLDRQGLWLDEGWSLWFATQADGQGLLMENHPPLYYALLAGFAKVLESDAALRATGAIASLLSAWVAYRLTLAVTASVRAACLAAALLLVSSVDVMVARELRMYAWMTLLYGLCLCGWWRYARAGDASLARRGWLIALAAGIALAYLHAVGIFFACAATVFGLVLARDWRARTTVAATGLVTAAAYLPWVWLSVLQRLGLMDAGLAWRPKPGLGQIASAPLRWFVGADPLFNLPEGADACSRALWSGLCHALRMDGGAYHAGRPGLAIVGLLLAIVVALGARRAWRHLPSAVAALAAATFVPMVLLLVLTWFVAPWFDVKYLAPAALPAACLVATLAASALARRLVDAASIGALLTMAVFAAGLPTTGTYQQWREAAQALQARWQPGEQVMLNAIGPGAELLLSRYLRLPDDAPPVLSLRQYVPDNYRSACQIRGGTCLDRLTLPPASVSASRDETVWMVQTDLPLDKPGSFPFSAELHDWLAERFSVVDVLRFDGIEVVKLRRRTG